MFHHFNSRSSQESAEKEQPKGFKTTKGVLTFRALRKLTNGYRTIELTDGKTYDYIGVKVETKEGHEITVALEVLPNGIMNLYAISSLYEIEQPKEFTGLSGKLVRISPQTLVLFCLESCYQRLRTL